MLPNDMRKRIAKSVGNLAEARNTGTKRDPKLPEIDRLLTTSKNSNPKTSNFIPSNTTAAYKARSGNKPVSSKLSSPFSEAYSDVSQKTERNADEY